MPYFPAIKSATYYTINYFLIGRIYDEVKRMAGGQHLDYLNSYYEMVFEWHKLLEIEIDQHIHGSTPNLQAQYFELLREALNTVSLWNDNDIIRAVELYNKETEEKFWNETMAKAETFINSEEYLKRKHKEEWEVEVPYLPFLAGKSGEMFKIKHIHYKWYIVEGGADVIDVSYLPMYLEYIRKISDNFKRIVSSNLKLWDEKKIKSNASTTIQLIQSPTENNQLESPKKETSRKKLKINLTIKQIAYLFKLLKQVNLLESQPDIDVAHFIKESFVSKKGEEISLKNLQNIIAQKIDVATVKFWIEKLRAMSAEAHKV